MHLMKSHSKLIVEDKNAVPLQSIETELSTYLNVNVNDELTEFQHG